MKIPQHVGFIMDGNRRWAKEQGFKLFNGYEVGVDRVEEIVEHADERGVKAVSAWVFSTENWKRSKLEIEILFRIFRKVLTGPMMQRLIQRGVKVNAIGNLSRFPKNIQKNFERIVDESKSNKGMILNLGLNYGGQEEIVHAVNKAAEQAQKEGRKITKEDISEQVYTVGQPEPDFIIRTGGEQRTSGFLLWQAPYAEWYFTKTYWPDFDKKEFDKALEDYDSRQRRFGK
jgi:undecaprenyl diphosphate synthase